MKRNSAIDYIKFLFAVIIVLYHFGYIFFGGYIVVEGFFMITGFLMMASLMRKREGEDEPWDCARFVLRKYTAIFMPLLISAIIGFFVYERLIYAHPTDFTVSRIPLLLFEVFPMQMLGFEGMWTTGVSWYLSAMLCAIAVLYPSAKKGGERFVYTVCPLMSLAIWGIICHNFGLLDVPNFYILNLINTGLLRGVAGISAGMVLYCLVKRSKTSVSLGGRIFYTVIELGCWAYLLTGITDAEKVKNTADFSYVAVIFLMLYIALSAKTVFPLFAYRKFTGVLSTASTYMFLNHFPWCIYFRQQYPHMTTEALLPRYLLCVTISSLTVYVLTKLISKAVVVIKKRCLKVGS